MAQPHERYLSEAEVGGLIPHERPFHFIGGVTILEPGKKARAPLADLTHPDFDYLKAHFPGGQIIPGVILVEALAELLGTTAASGGGNFDGKIGVFRKIREFSFRRPVKPTDSVMLETELIALRHGVGIGQVRAFLGENLAADGVISFALVDKEQLKLMLQTS